MVRYLKRIRTADTAATADAAARATVEAAPGDVEARGRDAASAD